ncbi:hypothetical protein TNCV_3305851 [Trichonephila clavipes]|nr:hypothetical protein TNCV_3305851 [Trichonephila clavipes]
MALSDLKAKRKDLRQAFTLKLKKIESELNKEIADRKELSVLRTLIDDKFQRLDKCQLLLSEELLKEENGEQLFSENFEEAETYRDIYLENCFKIENRLQENTGPREGEKKIQNTKDKIKKNLMVTQKNALPFGVSSRKYVMTVQLWRKPRCSIYYNLVNLTLKLKDWSLVFQRLRLTIRKP